MDQLVLLCGLLERQPWCCRGAADGGHSKGCSVAVFGFGVRADRFNSDI